MFLTLLSAPQFLSGAGLPEAASPVEVFPVSSSLARIHAIFAAARSMSLAGALARSRCRAHHRRRAGAADAGLLGIRGLLRSSPGSIWPEQGAWSSLCVMQQGWCCSLCRASWP